MRAQTSARRTLALVAIGAASACNWIIGNGYGRDAPDGGGGDPGDGSPTFDTTDEGIGPFEAGEEAVDAPSADRRDTEPGGECDLTKPFGPPELVFVDTDKVLRDAWLTPDERTIYFSTASQTGALHVGQRKELTVPFAYADALPVTGGVNTPGPTQYAPTLTANELILFYQYDNRPTDPVVRIRTSGRASRTGQFMFAFEVIGLPSDAGPTATPALNADASRLYFAVAAPSHLAYAPNVSEGYVGTTSALHELDGPGERYPTPSTDERTLYFMRAPVDGGTDNDIWVAQRGDASEPFKGASVVPELQTPYSEAPNWLSPDGCRLYFSSNRPLPDGGGAAYLRLWRATRGG